MNTLVLWDIDGTLLATKPGIDNLTAKEFMEAAAKATGKDNIQPPDHTHGSTDFAIMEEVLLNSGFSQKETSAVIFDAFSELQKATSSPSYIDRTRKAVPGAKQALATLPGIHTYGTGNLPGRAQAKASFFSLSKYLDPEIGGFGFWTRTRSDFLQYAHRAAEKKHQKHLQVVVIGDTPADIQGARECGFAVVAVAAGPYKKEELQEADLVLEDYRDLSSLENLISNT